MGAIEKVLRAAMDKSELSSWRIAVNAGVPQPVVHRFRHGQQSLTLGTVEKLCKSLGLVLVARGK
jgi:hypothetical protein